MRRDAAAALELPSTTAEAHAAPQQGEPPAAAGAPSRAATPSAPDRLPVQADAAAAQARPSPLTQACMALHISSLQS